MRGKDDDETVVRDHDAEANSMKRTRKRKSFVVSSVEMYIVQCKKIKSSKIAYHCHDVPFENDQRRSARRTRYMYFTL